MTITISPELEAIVRRKAEAEGLSAGTYVERLIREEGEWGDFEKVRAAVMEGLEQAVGGQGRPAKRVFDDLRAKHGIPR
jgi:hypothetical protein